MLHPPAGRASICFPDELLIRLLVRYISGRKLIELNLMYSHLPPTENERRTNTSSPSQPFGYAFSDNFSTCECK